MTFDSPRLHVLCGKIASGKSSLAARLAARSGTVLLCEDEWLHALFAEELRDLPDYVRCSARLRDAMAPHVGALLAAGLSVVLDFAANTPGQRRWVRRLVEATGAAHMLHVLDVPDEVCLARLRARNAAGGHPFVVTEDQFRAFARLFAPPTAEEGFAITVHAHDASEETVRSDA